MLVIFLLVASLWLGSYLWITTHIPDLTERGQFGDAFGAINALFSGLAFAAVIYSLYFQSKDLELQRFETSFFQLLSLLNDIVNSMDYQRRGIDTIKGRDVFRKYYDHLKREVEEFKIMMQPDIKGYDVDQIKKETESDYYKIPIEKMRERYSRVYNERESDLAHYFTTLQNIYRFIDDSKISDKQKYARILRGQLSSYELLFLFYNGLSEQGYIFNRDYYSKYSVLENLNFKKIFDKEHLESYPLLKRDFHIYNIFRENKKVGETIFVHKDLR